MDDTYYTKEQLFELYGKMPKDIQSIIHDENLGPAIQVIGKDHSITPTQALDVEDIVLHTLLGTIPIHNFARKIQEKLDISEEVAQKITKDIDENIFSQVKESLDEIHETERPETIVKIPITPPVHPPTPTTPKEMPRTPQAPFERKPEPVQPSTLPSKIVKKKPVPYEGVPTQTPSPTPPTPHKSIVGAEKVGVGIPPLKRPEEHMFERKLREVVPPEAQKPTPRAISPSTEAENKAGGQHKPLVETPSYGADPYKEPIE